jgi:hypothetical protein
VDPAHEAALLTTGTARLGGAVVDDRGFPIAGARVEAAGRMALSDRAGRFELTALPPGPWRVRVTHADFAPTETQLPEDNEAQLQLLPGGGIEGELRDPRSGRLPVGATLQLTVDGRVQNLPLSPDGKFQVTGVRSGRVSVSAKAPGYATLQRDFEVPPGDRPRDLTLRDLRLELERGGTVIGSVRSDDGDAVAGAQITAGAARARSDSRGEFRLEGVAPGRVRVGASEGGRRGFEEVEVRGDEESRTEITIR